MHKDNIQKYPYYTLYLVGATLSFILSYWVLLYRQPINVDGILYLNTANTFLQSGIRATFHSYSWPYYSIGIAVIHKLTFLNLEHSARFFDALLGSLITVAFVAVIKEFGANQRVLLWALIVILVFPFLNHLRDNILRDFGYNAFMLLSFVYFLRFLREQRFSQAIAWNLLTLVAILFRGEGLIIFIAAPLFLVFQTQLTLLQRLTNILRLYTLPLFFSLIALSIILFNRHISLVNIVNSTEIFRYLIHGTNWIYTNFTVKETLLRQTLFNNGLYNAVWLFLLAGMFAIFLQTFINTIGFTFFVLACFALYYHLIPKESAIRLSWCSYILLNLVIILGFIATDLFLADRYVLQLTLFIMLSVPFSIDFFYENWRNKTANFAGNKWVFPIISLCLIAQAISSLSHFGPSKSYILDAGNWIQQNTPPQILFYTNDAQLAYYSKRAGTIYPDDFLGLQDPLQNIRQVDLKKYDYAAILLPNSLQNEAGSIYYTFGKKPIKIFLDKRNDNIYIFKILKN